MEEMISIILPCYNQGIYLGEALESIIKQTYRNWEAIIVNDGSSDCTEEVALEYVAKDSRIHYFAQENKGVSAARNLGIEEALGKFVLPLDPDDMIAPTFIEKCMRMFKEHNDCILAYTKTSFCGVRNGYWNLPVYDDYKKLLLRNCIVCTSVFKREDCLRVGGYDENMHIGLEDWEFYIRLLQTDKKVYQVPESLFIYRIKEESRSTQCQKEENWTKVLIYIYKKHIDTYIHYYGSPLEILDKMYYYKGKYEKYYNTWYRRFWHKIRPRSKRRR